MGEYSSECPRGEGGGVVGGSMISFVRQIQQNKHFMGAKRTKNYQFPIIFGQIHLKLGIFLINEPFS